jgi:predicted nucleic acid-binding protein
VIFVDANYFLRLLTPPTTPQDQRMTHEAAALFRSVRSGNKEVTTSESVLAEVAFALTSPKHYGMSPADAASRLRSLFRLRGFTSSNLDVWFRALDIWAASPRLGLVDALTVAHAEAAGLELATFDTDFGAFPQLQRYQP